MNATPYAGLSFSIETNEIHEQETKHKDHPKRYNIQIGNRQQGTFKRGCHALCRDRNAFVQGKHRLGQTGLV
jgi:hypothetical protein